MGAETLEGGDMINGPPTVLEEFSPPAPPPSASLPQDPSNRPGLITKHSKAFEKSCEIQLQHWMNGFLT